MAKMILAALVLSSGVASAALLSAADYTCQGLRKTIANNGWQYVDGTLVHATDSDCSDYAQQAWIKTGDGANCPAGFVCLDSDPNASLTSN